MNSRQDVIHLHSLPAEDALNRLAPPSNWSDMGERDHFVQFYDHDTFLIDSILGFVTAGLRAGEITIVVATPAHRSALESRMQQNGLDIARFRASQRFLSFDADETLSSFMVNDQPDPILFDRAVGSVVRRAAQEGTPVRAFGEMVALLCRAGNPAAAVRLEELWNDLSKTCSFALFCAYPMKAFQGESNGSRLLHICSQHSRVIPSESYAAQSSSDARLRAIAVLQQKAASLEAEVAERKRVESCLREEQTRLGMAMAVAQLGVWELDLCTNELTSSDQCKAHFGLRPGDSFTCDRWFELIHPDDRQTFRNTFRNAVAINGDHCTEYRIINPDGHVRWISSLGRCYQNGFHRMIGVTLDITDRKQNSDILEQTVAERTSRLKEALVELESFSYSISHDMRAPLRSMQGFASILMEDCAAEISPEGRACLERIVASAERMDRLIQDVLTFSRVARTEFIMERVDLGRLVTGIIDSYPNLQPPRADIILEGDFPVVMGNTAGLTQCLSNLLSNAVKFVAPGMHPRVRVWYELPPAATPSIRLYVQDNGIGIPPEAHEKIFEIFHRVSKKYDGTGIGLAIVKKAAERMGGKVGVMSNPGAGSTFWLELRMPET